MFSKYSFGCFFTAECFISKCLFNLLGTSASFYIAELQIGQNGNGSSSGSEVMKPYTSVIYVSSFDSLLFIQRFHSFILANIFFHE